MKSTLLYVFFVFSVRRSSSIASLVEETDTYSKELQRVLSEIDSELSLNQGDEINYLRKELAKERIKQSKCQKSLGALENDNTQYKDIAARELCGHNIRCSLENFGAEYDGCIRTIDEHITVKVKAVLKNIKSELVSKSSRWFSASNNLVILCERKKASSEQGTWPLIEKDWNRNVTNLIKKFKSKEYLHFRTITSSTENPPSLTQLIYELYFSQEGDELKKFSEQCDKCFWNEVLTRAFNNFSEQCTELANQYSDQERQTFLQPYDVVSGTQQYHEKQFISVLFSDLSQYLLGNNKRYEKCVEVFYFAKLQGPISQIVHKLEDKWHLRTAQCINEFCTSFFLLYNSISNTDIHAVQCNTPLHLQYRPNSTYYYDYIKSSHASPEMITNYLFVTSILGLIDDQS